MRSMIYKWAGCMAMAAWVLGGISCTNEDITTGVAESKGEPWTIIAMQGGGVTTRLGYDDVSGGSVAVTWSAGDAFTVFGSTSGKANFTLQSGADEKSATFTSSDDKPVGDYRAFFPKAADAITSYNDCVMDLTGQKQTGNGSMAHLSSYDYMTGTVAFNGDEPTVNFEHQMLMMKFVLTLPGALASGESLESLFIVADKTDKATPAFYLKKGIDGTSSDETGNTQELKLSGVSLEGDHTLTAYLMMHEFSLAKADTLTFTVQTNKAVYAYTATINADDGKTYQKGYRYTATATLAASPLAIQRVYIPAGTFLMGSSDGSNPTGIPGIDPNATPAEPDRNSDETQHKVTLTKGFYMSKYEITNAQYAAFLNEAGIPQDGRAEVTYLQDGIMTTTETLVYDCTTNYRSQWGVTWNTDRWESISGYENHPIIYVTWYGAKAYADWVGGSLPTEAQWEYACRGGEANRPFGIGTGYVLNNTLANFNWASSWSWDGSSADATISNTGTYPYKTLEVGSYAPNNYGLYDMHGNVWEWCSDWCGNYSRDPVIDPVGTIDFLWDDLLGVVRGGCWIGIGESCRSARRTGNYHDNTYDGIGFRVLFFP